MSLPEELVQALQEVMQGGLFPRCWLATSDPQRGAQVRTVRILAYNLKQGHLTFGSHAAHAKHGQIQGDSRGQFCLLRPEPVLQVRLDVQLKSLPAADHPLGERMWQRVPPGDRLRFYQAHPQAPQLPACFWLVEAEVTGADILRLGEEANRRRLVCEDGHWKAFEAIL